MRKTRISKNAASIVAGATAKDKEFEPPWKHMLGMMLRPETAPNRKPSPMGRPANRHRRWQKTVNHR